MSEQNINKSAMLSVGSILRGIYRIDSYLSSGGFGNTYVATNVEFDEVVAIKEFFMRGVTQRDANNTTVSVSNSDNKTLFQEQLQKFKKEARRLRKMKSPHIVSVHDLFEENGTAYYVMDYIDGENLSKRLKRLQKPLSEKEVTGYLPQILDALECVHQEGIWHLDLKPANIMVDRKGNVSLIDFGASKQRSNTGGATTSTAVSFTNGFAPREQMEQNLEKFGPWTDLYALGATLYNLLANRKPPMPSDIDDDRSADKHLALPLPTGISEKTRQLILRLMTTDRLDRPQSVEEVRKMIEGEISNTTEGTRILDAIEETIIIDEKPREKEPIPGTHKLEEPSQNRSPIKKEPLVVEADINEKVASYHIRFLLVIAFIAIVAFFCYFIKSCNEMNLSTDTLNPTSDEALIELVSTDSLAAIILSADTDALSVYLTEAMMNIEKLIDYGESQVAKEYLDAVKSVLKENEDKLRAFAGTGDIASLIQGFLNLPDIEVLEVADSSSVAFHVGRFSNKLGEYGYEGEINDAELPEGTGEATFDNGNYYKGPFVKGNLSGEDGLFKYQNGDTFIGSFKDNLFDKGTYTVAETGEYFRGTFKDGAPAHGKWYDKKGNVLENI